MHEFLDDLISNKPNDKFNLLATKSWLDEIDNFERFYIPSISYQFKITDDYIINNDNWTWDVIYASKIQKMGRIIDELKYLLK